MPPDRPLPPNAAPRAERFRVPTKDVPFYGDVNVSVAETEAARDYLLHAPRAQRIPRYLGDSATLHVAVHDTVFSVGRPTHALGGVRIASDGEKLAPELAADMELKYLTLHQMFVS